MRLPTKTLSRLLMVLLVFALPLAVMAQKQGVKKTAKSSKTAPQKKTAGKSSPAKGTAYFEGALLYRNYEFHSSIIRKYSYGRAYNGERSIKVIMKGNNLHMVDEDMHIHTIILPGSNTGYIYSDVAKQGLKGSLTFFDEYLRVLDPDYQTKNAPKKSAQLSQTGETVSYKDDRCKIYRGYMMSGEDIKTDVEMWYSEKYRVYPSYRYVFAGLNPGGLLRKGIYNQSGKIPLLGSMKSLVSTELVALKSYKVPASEMTPPSNIVIRQATDNKQLVDFYKASRESLKKAKLTPKPKKTSEVKYDIRKQWDFADEWIANRFDSGRKDDSWEKIGNALFDMAKGIADVSSAVRSLTKGTESIPNGDMLMELLPSGRTDLLQVGLDMADDNGMIPIDKLIARLENQIAPWKSDLDAREKKSEAIASRPKEKKIINGKVMYLTSKRNLQEAANVWKGSNRSATHFVVNEWDARIGYLRKLQSRGQTHISKEAWRKYVGGRVAEQKKRHEQTMDRLYRRGYDQGVRHAQSFKAQDEYDLDYARSLRDFMRKERESSKSGIKKSSLEEWLDDLLK